MKAAVYHGPRDIRVEEVPIPAIADDEVLVRVVACGISGADLHLYRLGMFEALGRPVEGGRVMGHELAGEIAAVGASVRDFKPADRIAGLSLGRAGLGGAEGQRGHLDPGAAEPPAGPDGKRLTCHRAPSRIGPYFSTIFQ